MIKSEDLNLNDGDTSNKAKKKRRVNGRRGSNYTFIERQILIELTDKFKDIIEIKECNMSCIIKKRETWNEIARRYNTAQSSGPRTWQQLRHWYDNHKQVAKKGGLPKPISESVFSSITKSDPEPYLHRLFEVRIEEEDEEVKIVEEDDEIRIEDDQDSSQQSTSNEQSDDYSIEQNSENHRAESMQEQNNQLSMDSYCNEQNGENHRPQSAKEQYCQQSSNGDSNEQNKNSHKEESFKELYYREMLNNARLEKRMLINKKKMDLVRHRKEMEILRLKLKILQGRKHTKCT